MQPQNNVKLYPGLPEAPSSIRPNKHKKHRWSNLVLGYYAPSDVKSSIINNASTFLQYTQT